MNKSIDDEKLLTKSQVREILSTGIEKLNCGGKRILLIIPDGTRSMPMPLFFDLFEELLLPQTKKMDYLVALGTHQPMTDEQLSRLVGRTVDHNQVGDVHIYNHGWEDPGNFVRLGEIPDTEISEISEGRLKQAVPVTLNKLILDYDLLIVCGPVFPHEVVGFSGGNKYFFPGIAGPEIINLTHWLGALMTSYRIIGSGYTPVRAVIDRAAEMIPRETACFASVVKQDGLAGLYFGNPRAAWEKAAAHSARVHILYSDHAYKTVLAVMPEMYDDLWTAAKGMYKLEPVIADGGEVIIYAPHISEVSYTHGKVIDQIGYHCRDYFTKQWDRFSGFPGGVLAHSTHVKGMGIFDLQTGIETPRITVSLATGIPKTRCDLINLGYHDPALIDIENYRDRESEGVLLVPHAGEMLYRLKKGLELKSEI
jgi:nickel-dependent lactate racemase